MQIYYNVLTYKVWNINWVYPQPSRALSFWISPQTFRAREMGHQYISVNIYRPIDLVEILRWNKT